MQAYSHAQQQESTPEGVGQASYEADGIGEQQEQEDDEESDEDVVDNDDQRKGRRRPGLIAKLTTPIQKTTTTTSDVHILPTPVINTPEDGVGSVEINHSGEAGKDGIHSEQKEGSVLTSGVIAQDLGSADKADIVVTEKGAFDAYDHPNDSSKNTATTSSSRSSNAEHNNHGQHRTPPIQGGEVPPSPPAARK
ncbi:hypothetical protein Pmar_PMAR027117, partial [Perkinsus marinus ATCC 50983]